MENIIAENKTQLTGFTQIPNGILNDTSISWGAKGLWAYMAGKPENWKFTIRLMARQSKDSIDATTSRLNELIKAGYVVRQEVMTKNGKQCFYSIYGEPSPEKPRLEKPSLENPILEYSNKDISNKEISKNERKKSIVSYEEVLDKKEVTGGLRDAFIEFIKSRKLNGNKMTDHALELAINKVRRLSEDESEQIEIIEQSIMSGWSGLFPLRRDLNGRKASSDGTMKKQRGTLDLS